MGKHQPPLMDVLSFHCPVALPPFVFGVRSREPNRNGTVCSPTMALGPLIHVVPGYVGPISEFRAGT